jgi:hypothetical protein
MGNAQILRDISKLENVRNIPSEQILKDLEKIADSMQFIETTKNDAGKLYRLDFAPRREFTTEQKTTSRTREEETSLPRLTQNKETNIPKLKLDILDILKPTTKKTS